MSLPRVKVRRKESLCVDDDGVDAVKLGFGRVDRGVSVLEDMMRELTSGSGVSGVENTQLVLEIDI